MVAVAAPSPWEAMTRIAADMIALRFSSLLGLAMLLALHPPISSIRERLVDQLNWLGGVGRASRFKISGYHGTMPQPETGCGSLSYVSSRLSSRCVAKLCRRVCDETDLSRPGFRA